MWSALRGRALSSSSSQNLAFSSSIITRHFSSSSAINSTDGGISIEKNNKELLSLAEVEKILEDVGADDVKVFPAPERCEFTDYMVVATGRSPWHVRNISQALVYKAGSFLPLTVKQKQKGAKRMLLPAVVGQEGGKWIVIDSGSLIVHAVDEKARSYYNFEKLWTTNSSNIESTQDLEKAFVKIRRKNNSKKPSQTGA
ncbi:hypothetical protein BUALT_Bualt17G0024500 [Buddleja alternifolia]|uniref:Uncharacterized protein n=1 Tax=Buddleja alternifolia TaxID=168488 RepID=A0AAV6W719_9LAMI|nr:hypothetical protein BUALT_Bualt17G0024500 [Buddleja alternifolia]